MEDEVIETGVTDDTAVENQDVAGLPDNEPADALPDVSNDVDAAKSELARIKMEFEARENATKAERERYDKMLADTQKRMHEATQALAEAKKNSINLPPMDKGETFEEYRDKLLQKYEDDPREGIKKLITDMAVEMESIRATNHHAVRAAEEKAYKKALEKIPGYKDKLQKIKDLDENHPELSDLSEEKKMAILDMMSASSNPEPSRLTGVTGGSASVRVAKPDQSKKWTSDPEVQRMARQMGFTSKAELEKYANMYED